MGCHSPWWEEWTGGAGWNTRLYIKLLHDCMLPWATGDFGLNLCMSRTMPRPTQYVTWLFVWHNRMWRSRAGQLLHVWDRCGLQFAQEQVDDHPENRRRTQFWVIQAWLTSILADHSPDHSNLRVHPNLGDTTQFRSNLSDCAASWHCCYMFLRKRQSV